MSRNAKPLLVRTMSLSPQSGCRSFTLLSDYLVTMTYSVCGTGQSAFTIVPCGTVGRVSKTQINRERNGKSNIKSVQK
jgi:hypothetical protein